MTNYSLEDIQNALRKGYGAIPYLGCSGPRYNTTSAGARSNDAGFTVLSEVWYYFNVRVFLDFFFMDTNYVIMIVGVWPAARGYLGSA